MLYKVRVKYHRNIIVIFFNTHSQSYIKSMYAILNICIVFSIVNSIVCHLKKICTCSFRILQSKYNENVTNRCLYKKYMRKSNEPL